MAHSPGPVDRRAHLIREMARSSERSHSRGSAASSIGSARELPLQYDTATQELPLPSDQDFQIHSSALRRAFPDFSQYGSSEEDSIELGRGLKGSMKGTPGRNRLRSADVSENLSFSFGAGSRYEITGTPPLKPHDKIVRNLSLKSNTRASSMKENVDPLGKNTQVVSSRSTSSSQHDGRKVLRDNMHAKVESDDTGSISDRRPAPVMTTARNTRFDRRKSTVLHPQVEATGTLDMKDVPRGATRPEDAVHNSTVTGTHQSYLLPDLPNITELVSGVRQDGTPLFPRSARSASRFATPSHGRRPSSLKQSHLPISSLPIPAEEKALYVSLQLLQDKVAALEADKANAEDKLEEYELENLQLKSKLEEQERKVHSDSAMGTDIEEAKRVDWEGQKTQLESSIRSLQDRLDRANRKLSASELTIATLNNDRDAAHQQLAMAHLNSEELKNESESMQKEIVDVRNEFAKVTKKHEARIARLTNQEAELRGKIERREKAIKEMSSLAQELWATRNALATTGTNIAAARAEIANMRMHSTQIPTNNATVSGISSSKLSTVRSTSRAGRSESNTTQVDDRQRSGSRGRSHIRKADPTREVLDTTTDLKIDLPESISAHAELTIDSTYLSFMDGDEVAKLRTIVEADKLLLARTQGHEAVHELERTVHEELPSKLSNTKPLPRKSSMKSVSYKLDNATKQSIRADMTNHIRERALYDDEPMHGNETTKHDLTPERQDTQHSMISSRSQLRARAGQADMTSGFIVPDITLQGAAVIYPSIPTQGVMNNKQTTTIIRPVPVSERVPEGGDQTIRPAQSPGLALATVLRGLEDELQKLREQVAEQEALYNQHDPSLSKRQRKIVYARIQKLLATMETRADQIYALYDVLEGQRETGQMMKEEEVEVTLQNLGIDSAEARRVSDQTARTAPEVQDDSDADVEDYDDELPWEGLDPTQTQTLPSLSAMRVR